MIGPDCTKQDKAIPELKAIKHLTGRTAEQHWAPTGAQLDYVHRPNIMAVGPLIVRVDPLQCSR